MAAPGTIVTRTALLICTAALLLAGCGGGASTEKNPVTGSNASVSSYQGPAAATDDVQSFRLNLWDNINDPQQRCGACHGTGGQSPTFARMDDINLAYAQANTVVDLSTPSRSRMVERVANGHNCWLPSDSACADQLTTWISNWAGNSAGSANVVQLTAPPLYDPGDSRGFPPDSTLFETHVYTPLLSVHCDGCHAESSPNAQSPFFASSDVDSAYAAARSKMDLDNPANSRFVVRLGEEFHNCWSGDCQDDAAAMQAAIEAFAGQVAVTQIDPALVTSKALTLPEGIIASSGARHESNVIALYQFKTGTGSTAYDTSGVLPDMHLSLSGNIDWVGGWGIAIVDGKAQATTAASRKLHSLITATGEYSIEAWVAPANVSQEGPARIVSYSGGTTLRNFMLGQTQYNYDFLNRSVNSDANGDPALSTADDDEDLQATLQHVILTYDPVNGRSIYINGQFTDDIDPVAGGSLQDWDDSFALVLGNEVSGDRQWQGVLRLVAIHNRALTAEQILQNYEAGVGEKFFLLFSITDLVNVPESYIVFEVSQFDNYSYLFNSPFFISLDPDVAPPDIPVSGMRIGINGREAGVGQAWKHLDTFITDTFYSPVTGQSLSRLGSVIGQEKGADDDEFFLTFERLGSHTHVVLEPAPLAPATPPDLAQQSDIGLRTFEEIDASMAAITDVPREQVDVRGVYTTVMQQLPTVENIEGFLSAHQMAVSQMAIEYCNALVNDNGRTTPSVYFPGFAFNEPAGAALDTPLERGRIITPLLERVMGSGLSTQPDPVTVTAELDGLMLGLSACALPPAPTCDTVARTGDIVKAACAAMLGSGVMLIQ